MPKTISYLLEIKGGIAMAYSAQTAHYGLPLPVGSDRSSFLDTNESFNAVDTALYNAVTQNAQTEQEVQDLNAEIVALQSTVEGYAGDIAGLQNGLASTNLLVQEHASDIANLEGAVSNLATTKQNITDNNLVTTDKTIVGAINELAGATPAMVNNLAPEYDPTATYAVGDHVMHEDTYYVCSTAIAVAEAWDTTHWTQVKVGEEIEDLSSKIAELGDYVELYRGATNSNAAITSGYSISDFKFLIVGIDIGTCLFNSIIPTALFPTCGAGAVYAAGEDVTARYVDNTHINAYAAGTYPLVVIGVK